MDKVLYPLRHISIRVPWHDNGWDGSVCKAPRFNTACLKLKSISENKDESGEESVKGLSLTQLVAEDKPLPPCVNERGTFMADFDFVKYREHPYVRNNSETHGHFLPTPLYHPAYAAAALPFRWFMRNSVLGDTKNGMSGFVERFPLDDVSLDYEPNLGFDTDWFQDHRNHRTLLECFWSHVQKEKSLVFFYAKQVPLVEDTGRRVLIGVGRVKKVGNPTEYDYDDSCNGKLRSFLWEQMVIHSIRPDFSDGFILPYYEALEKSDEGRLFDPAEAVAFAPEDRFVEFSYATEHVSNDAAISSLLSIRGALQRCSRLFNYESKPYEQWIDRELGRLWNKRGPFPGVGVVLSAMGVGMGNFMAQALINKVGEDGDPWQAWFGVLDDPDEKLPADLSRYIDTTIAKLWKKMDAERLAFLQLLSRFDLTQEQANMLVDPAIRKNNGISLSDHQIIANPYLIYEVTRLLSENISVGIVDRGMFPNEKVRNAFPIPMPSLVKTPVDVRRLRALTIRALEAAAATGNTLRPRDDVVRDLCEGSDGQDEVSTQITADFLNVAEEDLFEGEIRIVSMADGRPAYQLDRLGKTGDLICTTIRKRIAAARHDLKIDWRKALDTYLAMNKVVVPDDPEERNCEEAGRCEKTAALEELAASRFSVLIGRAGTGKTTLLSVLCAQQEINQEGVLLLAPTGKARVRMEGIAKKAGIGNLTARTLAQHLNNTRRYNGKTQRYQLTGERGQQIAKTVIVDECSMLTEEMMAALMESLSKVDRLIFVGDYRQLPPIGPGRPFMDIVTQLMPDAFAENKPHVAPSFTELMVPRRQGAGQRDDLLLASWFGGGETGAGDDTVFDILTGQRKSETVEFVDWESPEDLEECLPGVLQKTLGFNPEMDKSIAFGIAQGGTKWNDSVWFNNKYGSNEGAGIAAEAWQILSSVRQKPWGVDKLNRFIHKYFRGNEIAKAHQTTRYRSIPRPKGEQEIIYGDKVINNRNWTVPKSRIYPDQDSNGYLANGEVGIVVGHRKTKKRSWTPKNLEIEFSTQRGKTFTYYDSDFKEEGDSGLELAYALTVHKAQGSEFNKVLFVLPRSPIMITRELLYTALTRQKEKVVILIQGSATDLHRFSSEQYSATACRLTNLFGPPNPIEFKGALLEEKLIHNTIRGELVRSKSEVIIANMLNAKNIDYDYEQELTIRGEPKNKFPDFTIEDDDTGKKYIWEHLGMLGQPDYKKRWKEKEQWYRDNDILSHKEGGGGNGTLIVTRDDPRGGIDSQFINELIDKVIIG
jgi:hypothetical protein